MRSDAPRHHRSGSSLASSTTNAPSRPCGLPTRPILIRNAPSLQPFDRLVARRCHEEVLAHELLGPLPTARSNGFSCTVDGERRPPELDVIGDSRPKRRDLTFV